ncbi:phosphoenolpyruvate--protein phosphotransferase [Cumulibacter manganitolerans]|uniref:phosphoenolpyruvate--protein phosphotransferase n=1 Tax=Cumulibacter manganitolerans TaxID=1884992 RepID=UPI001294E745|nr:phosphoenolpyruvate--protein phosphotransferase [Cumulibacter manganitolerans]
MATNAQVRTGTPVVQGIALGPVVRPAPGIDLGELPGPRTDAEGEKQRYADAVAAVSERLRARARAATGVAAEVLLAQVALVGDKGLRKSAARLIDAGAGAEQAMDGAAGQFVEMFTKLGGLMAERTTDLCDLRSRVIAELLGRPEPGVPSPDVPSVLMADDLAPADTATLDPATTIALVTRLGGPTSHTAIIARQLGVPCIVAAPVGDIPAGTTVLVDGGSGTITIDPDPAEAQALIARDRATRAAAAAFTGPGGTQDGHRVQVLANVQDGPSAERARRGAAEGVGLFRSELAFLGRDHEPTVEQQSEVYGAVLRAFEGRKVVIRTLDAGSDKPMKFANLAHEDNPALGVRGSRLAVANPGLMSRQLDAIADAAARTAQSPWVMAPMIATAAEAADFARQVRERSLTPGVMVEIPSAALRARELLQHVDFLSIGTNDLSQYTMAADRLSADLAELTDPWQPAVLQLIEMTARAGAEAGKPVGVCGEAAADAMLACVLVGLGVTSLSMAASAVGTVGAAVAGVSLEQCRRAAGAALEAASPAAARAGAAEALGR